MKTLIQKLFPHNLMLITISGLLFMMPFKVPLLIVWVLNLLICSMYIIIAQKYIQKNRITEYKFILIYFSWNLICILRGTFVAEDYWQWKALLGNVFQMLMPIFIFTYISPKITGLLMKNLLKYGLILAPFIIFLATGGDVVGRYFSFFYFYMIVLFALPTKWKVIVIVIAALSVFANLEARSGAIRSVVALGICCIYYLRIKKIRVPKIVYIILMTFPFILITLGILGIFNPFQFKTYINYDDNATNQELFADTRTGLYEEIISSSVNNKYIIQGRTPARGYETTHFEINTSDARKMNIKIRNERGASEVSILNVYTYCGIIGVILYFAIFCKASYLALYKSKNLCIQLIGIFIIFRWYYAWIEDFTNFDINYATLWMMIAMCFSYKFRNMTNLEFKYWILSTLPFLKKS